MNRVILAIATIALSFITTGACSEAQAQGPGSLPFSNTYRRPSVSPYTLMGDAAAAGGGGGMPNAMSGGMNPLVFQQLVQPRLEQERQQIEMGRQSKQLGGLQNQVQQIQRNTSMRQIDSSIRPTGHASTFQNLSHFYPQR